MRTKLTLRMALGKCLKPEIIKQLKNVFDDSSDGNLSSAGVNLGKMQNATETFNGTIWN